MSEQRDKISDIIQRDAEEKRWKQKSHQEISFRDYLKLLTDDPLIAQSSPSRIWEIIQDTGITKIPEEEQWLGIDTGYELFTKELYGVDRPISRAVEHIKVGATRGSSGKYILVLVGPPAAGKSTFVRLLVEALEKYNKRPIFKIKGCPKQEEPLHLLPRKIPSRWLQNKKGIEL